MTVTNLRDAKENRRMGFPLNMEVRDGGMLSEQACKPLSAALDAGIAFSKRCAAFYNNKNLSGFHAMRRAHDKLVRVLEKGTAVVPGWKETEDGGKELQNVEQVAVMAMVQKVALTSLPGWQELFDAVDEAAEAGEDFEITADMLNALWPFNGAKLIDDAVS